MKTKHEIKIIKYLGMKLKSNSEDATYLVWRRWQMHLKIRKNRPIIVDTNVYVAKQSMALWKF